MARADAGSVWRSRAPQPRLLKDPGCLAQVLLIAPDIICGGTMLIKRSSSRNLCRSYPKFIPMSDSKSHPTRSAEIRERVGHPIIDSDGHVVEFEPTLLDYIREAGGSAMLERYKTAPDTAFYFRWNHATPAERREFRLPRPVWWPYPTKNTYDRATAALP